MINILGVLLCIGLSIGAILLALVIVTGGLLADFT